MTVSIEFVAQRGTDWKDITILIGANKSEFDILDIALVMVLFFLWLNLYADGPIKLEHEWSCVSRIYFKNTIKRFKFNQN